MVCDAKQCWLRVCARIVVVSRYGLLKASGKSIKSLHCITYGRAHDKTIGRNEESEKRIHCRWFADRRRQSQLPTGNKTKPIVLLRLEKAMSAVAWLRPRLGITSSNFPRIFINKIRCGQFPCTNRAMAVRRRTRVECQLCGETSRIVRTTLVCMSRVFSSGPRVKHAYTINLCGIDA